MPLEETTSSLERRTRIMDCPESVTCGSCGVMDSYGGSGATPVIIVVRDDGGATVLGGEREEFWGMEPPFI
jgi:hypothetical protein